jgi:hypothetical protein
MPTVNYGESLREIHAKILDEWEAADETTRGVKPALGLVEELEHVNVTYPDPDEWIVEHEFRFHKGWSNPDNSSIVAKEVYAAIELCDGFEGIEMKDIRKMPLHYWQFLQWLRGTVLPAYYKAMTVPNA